MPRSLRLLLLLAAACGPTLPETTTATESTDSTAATEGATSTTSGATAMSEGTGSTDPPTTGVTTTTTTTTGPTTTTSTTGEPDTTTTTTGTTTGETTFDETTGSPACEDADPGEVKAQWMITFPKGDPQETISADCTVTDIDEIGQSVVVALSCALDFELAVELAYIREPVRPPPLFVGEKIVLEYREEPIFWINRWFSIRSADNPLTMKFGGISADHIEPPGATVEEFYATPLAVVEGACDPFNDGPCGLRERLALEVPFGFPSPVFDGQFREVVNLAGHYDLWLEAASRPVDPNGCEDVPPAWFQALMIFEISP